MENSNSVLQSYSKIAKWFDEHRSRELFEKPWLDKAIMHLQPSATVLDLGCGMGEPIAKYFISQGYDLTAVDGCEELIAIAKQRLPLDKIYVADMRTLSLGKQFDCIIAWDSFFHLTANEQRSMFKIFVEHIKKDGILLFTSGPEAGEVWSDNGGEQLYHASLAPTEYQAILQPHGFVVLEHKIDDPECYQHTVWLAKYSIE